MNRTNWWKINRVKRGKISQTKREKYAWDPFNLYVNQDGSPNRLPGLFNPLFRPDGSPNILAQLHGVQVRGGYRMRSATVPPEIRMAAVPPDRPPVGMARFRHGPGQDCGRVDELPGWQQPAVPAFGVWLDLGWVPAGYAWWASRRLPASSEITQQLLRPGEDTTAFALEVVRRLRGLETGGRDWPRTDIEHLHEEFLASVLSNMVTDCREAFASLDQTKAALRSAELPEEETPLRDFLQPHEYAPSVLLNPIAFPLTCGVASTRLSAAGIHTGRLKCSRHCCS